MKTKVGLQACSWLRNVKHAGNSSVDRSDLLVAPSRTMNRNMKMVKCEPTNAHILYTLQLVCNCSNEKTNCQNQQVGGNAGNVGLVCACGGRKQQYCLLDIKSNRIWSYNMVVYVNIYIHLVDPTLWRNFSLGFN